LHDDLGNKKAQLDEIKKEESYQLNELGDNQDEMERLYKDLKAQEDEAKYLDGQKVKMNRNCMQLEDDLGNSRSRNRDLSVRVETVKRMRNLIEEECCGG